MIYIKQLLSILIGMSLLFLSGSYLFKNYTSVRITSEASSVDPDYSMSSLKIEQYDKNGQLANAFATPKLNHIPDNNRFDFIQPNLMVSKAKEQPVFISSSAGKAYSGGKKIVLTGNVLIKQPSQKNHPETIFSTEELMYFHSNKYAESKKPVTFVQGLTHIQAAGARIEFNSHNQIKTVIIKGNQAHFWTQKVIADPVTHAFADIIYYYPQKNLIKLKGHAKVKQAKNEFNAEIINYNTLLQQVNSQAGSKSIKMIFYRKENRLSH